MLGKGRGSGGGFGGGGGGASGESTFPHIGRGRGLGKPLWPENTPIVNLGAMGRGRGIRTELTTPLATLGSVNQIRNNGRAAVSDQDTNAGDWNWPIATQRPATTTVQQATDYSWGQGIDFGFRSDAAAAVSTNREYASNRDSNNFGSQGGFGTGYTGRSGYGYSSGGGFDQSTGGSGFTTTGGGGGGFSSSNDGGGFGGFSNPSRFGSSSGSGFGGFNSQGFGSSEGFTSASTSRSFGDGFKKKKSGFGGADSGVPGSDLVKSLPVILKDFYVEDPEIAAMTEDEVAVMRMALNNITVIDQTGKGRTPRNPVQTFAQAFSQYPEMLEQIQRQGFQTPTPIQSQMWPISMSGFDVIGIAQTGTGKTLGFLAPIFIHLDKQPGKRDGPGCIILSPTRELAQQIHAEVKKYRYKEMRSVCIYGKSDRMRQVKACEEGVDIIIATPGRLRDLMDDEVFDPSAVTFVVLDEADRMLDMGFEPEINAIMMDIRKDRQVILTSATWPVSVQKLAEKYTVDPFLIRVGSLDLSAVHSVTQQIFITSSEEKRNMVVDFLFNMKDDEKVIIFVSTKKMANQLASYLNSSGLKCAEMHGDREQEDREKALRDLKHGRVRIMVATDVASRGLDVADITHVINYDFPNNMEEYVHRVGRTGRAGKSGVAISLMTYHDRWHSTKLIGILMEANQVVPEDLLQMSERHEAKKAELSAAGEDYRPPLRGRPREERRSERRSKVPGFFDPYTGEPF